jgi:hypothetical protein
VRLYSYVVARDYGFAPNPFFGVCTLATCKPIIRRTATIGDWVIGTGSKVYGLQGRLVYAMNVSEVLSYDEYWREPRYRNKRPNLTGSRKQAYGDNIYHRTRGGRWVQADSHHSNTDGSPNPHNIAHDTQTPRVLIGVDFVYWGALGPKIPKQFRHPIDVCAHRGHKCSFPPDFTASFVEWIRSFGVHGYAGAPAEFPR